MTKKKTRRKGSKRALSLNDQIHKLFKRSPKKRLNARQVIKKLKLSENVDAINARLDQLKKDGKSRNSAMASTNSSRSAKRRRLKSWKDEWI